MPGLGFGPSQRPTPHRSQTDLDLRRKELFNRPNVALRQAGDMQIEADYGDGRCGGDGDFERIGLTAGDQGDKGRLAEERWTRICAGRGRLSFVSRFTEGCGETPGDGLFEMRPAP